MGKKKMRAGQGFLGLGDPFKTKSGLTDRALFRAKHMMAPGSASFAPGTGWKKGGGGGLGTRNIGGTGKMTAGKSVYQGGGRLTQLRGEGGDIGREADIYEGGGTGAIGAGAYSADTGNEFSPYLQRLGHSTYIKQGWEQGVKDPYKNWWKGELRESQDYWGAKPRELSQDLLTTLGEGGVDTSELEGTPLTLTQGFSQDEWDTTSGAAQESMDVQLEALRDVWIESGDYADDDPRKQARLDLEARMAEAGLDEEAIFGEGVEATTGTIYQDIERTYEKAESDKELSSRQAARERIKANLQGGAGVRGAQSAAGASGLAYSGAHQGRIEQATAASQDAFQNIREGEKKSFATLEDAKVAREFAYDTLMEGVTGETGAFSQYEDAREEKFQAGETYLSSALDTLEAYGSELKSMLSYGPSAIMGKGDIKRNRSLRQQRSRFWGGTAMHDRPEYESRHRAYKTSKTAVEKAVGQIGED